jgi:hypothetical protein
MLYTLQARETRPGNLFEAMALWQRSGRLVSVMSERWYVARGLFGNLEFGNLKILRQHQPLPGVCALISGEAFSA